MLNCENGNKRFKERIGKNRGFTSHQLGKHMEYNGSAR